MKKLFSLLFAVVLSLPLCSFDNIALIGKPMPLLPNKTLDGKTIDAAYYHGHITLVNFMFIGCFPCMNEIGMLNRLHREYAANPNFQMLCIARQTKEQMIQFNEDGQSIYSKMRTAFQAEPMEYAIQPACAGDDKMETAGDNITVHSQCETITETYSVNSFPSVFFVDKKGIIRKIGHGGPASRNDTSFYNELKKDIDLLLRE